MAKPLRRMRRWIGRKIGGYPEANPPQTRLPRARSVAAITMVYASPTLLAKWVRHYGDLLGRENLFIVSHGPCSEHEQIASGCNYVVVPRETLDHFDGVKASLLSGLSSALLSVYEAVVCGDTDELIVVDPESGISFKEYVLNLPKGAIVAPLGFDIIPTDEELNGSKSNIYMPLLRQVNRAIFVWQFCKPSILKRPSRFSVGLHGLIDDEFSVDSNLILFHLKFLALNEPEYYEALSGEAKRSSTGGSKLWAAGFEGLRQRVSEVNHAGASLPVMEPQKAAIGCYSMDQSRLKPEARVAGNPFRVAGEGSSSAFALPERWLDLV